MTRRFLLVLVAALSMLAVGSVSYGAGKATKHKVSDVGLQRILNQSGGPVVLTGTLKDPDYGEGATVARASSSKTVPNSLVITGTAYYRAGTVRVKGSIVSTPDNEGGATYAGTLKAVSGTGVFKGAAGSLAFSGSATPVDPTLIGYTLKGTLTY